MALPFIFNRSCFSVCNEIHGSGHKPALASGGFVAVQQALIESLVSQALESQREPLGLVNV